MLITVSCVMSHALVCSEEMNNSCININLRTKSLKAFRTSSLALHCFHSNMMNLLHFLYFPHISLLLTDHGCVFQPNDDTLIQVDGTSTHIICDDEAIRVRLKDTLLKCLKQL